MRENPRLERNGSALPLRGVGSGNGCNSVRVQYLERVYVQQVTYSYLAVVCKD